jgi:hypothetical protein
MSKKTKSVIEEAYQEARRIDETFKANTKEILSNTMGSEIESMVAETLKSVDEGGMDYMGVVGEDDDLATDLDLGDNDEVIDFDVEGPDMDGSNEMEIVDLTNSSDDELIKVFKAMDPDSEIEVVQDEEGISFTDQETGAEYKVEMGGSLGDEMEDEMEIDVIDMDGDSDEMEFELDSDDGETTYEIEIDVDELEDGEDVELEEGSRTLGNGRSHGRRGLPKPKAYKRMSESRNRRKKPSISLRENKKLKEELSRLRNEKKELQEDQVKMVGALKDFRQKLHEVAVFNSNLTHVVRILTENTTTKQEKLNIVSRMDEATSIKESKLLFKTITSELSNTGKKQLKETIENKVNKVSKTGSKQTLTETKVYSHPDLDKMKRMWEYDYIKKDNN